jgi:hypothetical protein
LIIILESNQRLLDVREVNQIDSIQVLNIDINWQRLKSKVHIDLLFRRTCVSNINELIQKVDSKLRLLLWNVLIFPKNIVMVFILLLTTGQRLQLFIQLVSIHLTLGVLVCAPLHVSG